MTSLALGADRIGVGIACAVAGFSAGDAISKWLIGSRGITAFELFFFFGLFALPVAAGHLYGLVLFGDTIDAVTMAGAAVVIGSGLTILWRETRRRSGAMLDLG
ncbi:hypothetical protein AB4Z01_26890 [Inquilinus sp. YAF38]|uniref:hypothetical protein n=1 Tax=Inquilinus sp. YAF38 TaxID=3233084 RepID=UPI003F93F188